MKKRDVRPDHRDERLTIPLDKRTLDKATKRAGGRSRLVSIFRILLGLYADEEYPPRELGEWYDEEDIQQDQRRAKKRKKGDDD